MAGIVIALGIYEDTVSPAPNCYQQATGHTVLIRVHDGLVCRDKWSFLAQVSGIVLVLCLGQLDDLDHMEGRLPGHMGQGIRQLPNTFRFADKSRRLDRSCQGFVSFQVQCICTHRKMAWCKYIAPCHAVIALGLALFASVLRCAQSAPQTLPPTFYIPTVLPRRTVPTPHTLPLSAPHSGRGNTPLFCRPG